MSARQFALKRPEPLESDVLSNVMAALERHPKVAFVNRMNTGAVRKGKRFIRFGFPGSPDVHGVLKGGRALYVEVKRPSTDLEPAQVAFKQKALEAGAHWFVARSIDDVFAHMEFA